MCRSFHDDDSLPLQWKILQLDEVTKPVKENPRRAIARLPVLLIAGTDDQELAGKVCPTLHFLFPTGKRRSTTLVATNHRQKVKLLLGEAMENAINKVQLEAVLGTIEMPIEDLECLSQDVLLTFQTPDPWEVILTCGGVPVARCSCSLKGGECSLSVREILTPELIF